jgi:hypothetical protein
MSADQAKEIRVVVYTSNVAESEPLESQVALPGDAEFADLIDALRDESPTVYEEVRRRVLRAAGRVLAYGRDDPLLMAIDEKLEQGGTLIFPAEEDDAAAAEVSHVRSAA